MFWGQVSKRRKWKKGTCHTEQIQFTNHYSFGLSTIDVGVMSFNSIVPKPTCDG